MVLQYRLMCYLRGTGQKGIPISKISDTFILRFLSIMKNYVLGLSASAFFYNFVGRI